MDEQDIEYAYKQGMKYLKGKGVPIDKMEAQKYFRIAADGII